MPYLREHFGNPSSGHIYGQRARAAVERAREQVASLLACQPDEIVFTSGGTEANNLAIRGVLERAPLRRHIVTSTVEHPATTRPCELLERHGAEVTRLPVDGFGRVRVDDARPFVRSDTALVTIMLAQNEVGTLMPVAELAGLAHERGALVHTDAAQAVGKIPTRVDELRVDLLSVAGHKLYAPKGVGALFVRRGTPLAPVLVGAGHERGLRPGTENVPFIVGLGAACELAAADLNDEADRQRALRDELWDALRKATPAITLNGHPDAARAKHAERVLPRGTRLRPPRQGPRDRGLDRVRLPRRWRVGVSRALGDGDRRDPCAQRGPPVPRPRDDARADPRGRASACQGIPRGVRGRMTRIGLTSRRVRLRAARPPRSRALGTAPPPDRTPAITLAGQPRIRRRQRGHRVPRVCVVLCALGARRIRSVSRPASRAGPEHVDTYPARDRPSRPSHVPASSCLPCGAPALATPRRTSLRPRPRCVVGIPISYGRGSCLLDPQDRSRRPCRHLPAGARRLRDRHAGLCAVPARQRPTPGPPRIQSLVDLRATCDAPDPPHTDERGHELQLRDDSDLVGLAASGASGDDRRTRSLRSAWRPYVILSRSGSLGSSYCRSRGRGPLTRSVPANPQVLEPHSPFRENPP